LSQEMLPRHKMKLTTLLEEIINPEGSLGISRDEMPQIDGEHIGEFLDYVSDEGKDYEKCSVPAGELQPSQNELDTDKADKIWNEDAAFENPLIISQDNYILDGHHRWLAVHRHDKDAEMDCIKLGDDAKESLELMHGFSKTKKRDIEDNDVKECLAVKVMCQHEEFKGEDVPFEKLKDNKVNLSDEERAEVEKGGAEWSDGRSAVMKSVIGDKTYFTTYTHRAYNCCKTLAQAIERFHAFIKGTA
jgi:hypothetical protein